MNENQAPDNVNDFQLRYVGPRFEGTRLPVEVLSDLPAFRELIVSFVKAGWYAEHADKVRLPKGFDQSLTFDLVGLTNGSAVPNLNWNRSRAQAYLPGMVDQLEHLMASSFNQLVHLVDTAEDDGATPALTAQQVRALNKLGSGLRDDERIEFLNTTSSKGAVVYLDNEKRKRLMTRIKGTYETRVEGIGVLVQAKIVPTSQLGSVVISVEKYGDVEINREKSIVVEEFAPYLTSEVQYDLQIEVDHNDLIRNVVHVHDIGVIDPGHSGDLLICRDRIKQLGDLPGGWNEGDGIKITQPAIDNAGRLLAKRSSVCHLFKIFPTEEGGISFELESSGWDYTIEFLENGKIQMFGIEIDGDATLRPVEYEEIEKIFLDDFDKRIGA
ncbi:MAG: hypothetical protein M3Y65_20710 [Pseudomonadota bacterium]|nr:hypothetical protein [Pseudomonadota bacterium]